MFRIQLLFVLQQTLESFCFSSDTYFYAPYNVTRSTISGIAEYRSALTLDWLAAEDNRQRELVSAFETESPPPARVLASECMTYSKPASGKVARLMLELLKNLEGDDGTLITDLIQALIRSKLLVETSMLDAEPNLEALVKTPGVMIGEPHSTFPRILATVWMSAGDTTTIKKHGWCPISKITKYLSRSKPAQTAKHMRSLDPVIARARYIMEEFIQHITPINVFADKQHFEFGKKVKAPKEPLANKGHQVKRPARTTSTIKIPEMEFKAVPTMIFEDKIANDEQEKLTKKLQARFILKPFDKVDFMRPKDDHASLTVPYSVQDAEDVAAHTYYLYITVSAALKSLCPSLSSDNVEPDFSEDRWLYRNSNKHEEQNLPCFKLKPAPRDIVRRFYAILPYFDKDHSNTAFLHKLRATVYGMSEGDDLLDKEAAFYAAILTPLVFLQQYRDMWCLLERFHRAIRLYQISHPTEKRSALKLLQNLRAVNNKIRSFVVDLPGPASHPSRTTPYQDPEDEEIHDNKDIRYLKELIKNLG